MAVRPARRLAAASALTVTLLVGGCSSEPAATGPDSAATEENSTAQPADDASAPPKDAAAWVAYYECLSEQGLVLEDRDDGKYRLDKDQNSDAEIKAGEKQCADLQPEQQPVSDATLEKARAFSACMRENGVPDFPDPNPTTGDLDVDAEKLKDLKYDAAVQAAKEKCRPKGTSSSAPAAE